MSCLKMSSVLPWLAGIGLLATIATATARDDDPDPVFGANGRAFPMFAGGLSIQEIFVDVKVLTSGKLLVSATVNTGTAAATDMGIMRLNPNGSTDMSFGVAGARVVGFDRAGGDNSDFVRRMAVQPDGRILLVGEAAGGTGGADMAVVRLNVDGSLDTGFGSGGKTTVAFDLGATAARRDDQAFNIIVLSNGRIVIGGVANTAGGSVMAVARLTASGILDTAFDGDGKRTLDFGGGVTDRAIAYNLLASADGERIYAVGEASLAGNTDFAIARLLGNGSLDTAFAGDGTVTFGFDVSGDFFDSATEAVELPDGMVLLCGYGKVDSGSNSDFACIRLRTNGTVDTDFAPVLIPFDLVSPGFDEAFATRLDFAGRIVMVGVASAASTNEGTTHFDFAVARLLTSGQLDPSFGVDGRMTYDGQTTNGFNAAFALGLPADGKIVIAGAAANAQGSRQLQVLRLKGDTLFEDGFEDLD